MVIYAPKILPDMEPRVFEILLQLRDIHFPPQNSFLFLIGFFLILSLFLRWFWKNFLSYQGRKGRIKKAALKKLAKLIKKHQTDESVVFLASEISILLKRVALVCFDKKEVSKLYGQAWSDFIAGQASNAESVKELADLIAYKGYMPPEKDEKTKYYISKFNVFVKDWIGRL